jgi:hypothetical protein
MCAAISQALIVMKLREDLLLNIYREVILAKPLINFFREANEYGKCCRKLNEN